MKNIHGFWLPDDDTYFADKPNYEIKETNIALNNVNNFHTAIDVGAHCGYWTRRLSCKFKNIISFEPVKEHFDCLKENTKHCENVKLINAAASDVRSDLLLERFMENSGKSKISNSGHILIKSITIDELELNNVDFIKVDVEGHESKVILGASRTIEIYKPVLFIEINENYDKMEKLLNSIGYENTMKIKFNYIWKYKE